MRIFANFREFSRFFAIRISGFCDSPSFFFSVFFLKKYTKQTKQDIPTSLESLCSVSSLNIDSDDKHYSPHSDTKQQHTSALNTKTQTMDLTIKDFDEKEHVVEVGVDDALGHLRLKVASAAGLQEDSFQMTFRGEVLREEEGIKELSAGDTIMLMRTTKFAAIAALHALGETDLTKETLETVDDPDVVRLLLEAEVATVIPDRFLRYSELTRLDLSAVSVVTEIGDWFLNNCSQLTELDLSGLCNVTVIGGSFITFAERLESINLSGFGSVTKVGRRFLASSALRTVDLSVFRHVTVIERDFLSNCKYLTFVNLSGLSNVTKIGHDFLVHCSALKRVCLSGLRSVVTIGVGFFGYCSRLQVVDGLSALSGVRSIGMDFFMPCQRLTRMDASGLSKDALVVKRLLAKEPPLPTNTIHGLRCETDNVPDPATVQKEGCRRKRLHADTEPSEEREAGFAESKGSPACSFSLFSCSLMRWW